MVYLLLLIIGTLCFVIFGLIANFKMSNIENQRRVMWLEEIILVTEQGLADLRGLAPKERAQVIIDNCMHPDYKEQMQDYVEEALKRGGQTPHIMEKAFSWHLDFKNNGSMKKQVEVPI